MISNKDRQLS